MGGLAEARDRIRELGQQISPAILAEMQAFAQPALHPAGADVRIERDLAYGEHERHRLNLFIPQSATGAADVLIFVHGGGFVTGDKEDVPGAFYDNLGLWAAAQGMIGVTISYRLAPGFAWPSGRDDAAAACRWVADNIAQYGGDPARIFLMGHSAGAAHVAGVVAQTAESALLAGCICLSGIYDLTVPPVSPAYFGEDASLYPERSPLDGLAASQVPLLVLIAQYDPEFIQRHFANVTQAVLEKRSFLPHLNQITGHNHFSALLHLNTGDTALADPILAFVAETAAS